MRRFISALVLSPFVALAACSGSQSIAPLQAEQAQLAAATSSVCVNAQNTPQTVQLPDTGGISASLNLGKYDSGTTGCQNITIATGDDASAATARRRFVSGPTTPVLSITLGTGLPASSSALQLTTVLSGMTLSTDPNVVFPDGTYNATITLSLSGASITYSLVFTASGGQLSVTGGNVLPLTLGSGAVINVYNRGIIPPGFESSPPTPSPTPSGATPTPSASPTVSASPTASANPTATPTAVPTPNPSASLPANGATIGSASTTLDLPGSGGNGEVITFPIVYSGAGSFFQTNVQNGNVLPGVTTYVITGLSAALSYRVDGCSGQISYGGTGTAGSFTVPYGVTLAVADTCAVDLFSAPAAVVNAAPNHGFAYAIFSVISPVSQTLSTYPPAVNI
jgi:hypothetical protein